MVRPRQVTGFPPGVAAQAAQVTVGGGYPELPTRGHRLPIAERVASPGVPDQQGVLVRNAGSSQPPPMTATSDLPTLFLVFAFIGWRA